MHRLQISLPAWQAQYLNDCAARDGVSMAEVVRRLIADEAAAETLPSEAPDRVLGMAGMAEDRGPLLDDLPVSEAPERYLEGTLGGPHTGERYAVEDLSSNVAEGVTRKPDPEP